MLDRFLLGQTEGLRYQALGSELYTASRLLQEINVRFKVASERNKGITHTLIIPKRWPSWMQDVSALQLAAEICRKEARAEVQNISGMLLSLTGAAPDKIHDSLEKISSRVQELGVLCNRSLFLIDNLNRRFEAQQDHLLKWEIEQMATAEAIVHVSREIARSLELSQIFEIGSAKRVAKYALAIAKELELPEGEYQALRHAALLKDLGLVLSIDDMVKRKLVPTHEHAMSVKGCFELVWKALADVPYLSSALVSVRYRYEKYDGTAKHYGAGGTDIPLGARILAVADAFESMTASSSLEEKCSPRQAVAMISDGSGQRFDPGVVDAFMSAWKKKELHPVLNES
jgi:response regulator RpfG family c-di-GMP phosphodiesterase